jgi:putative endonuclease
MLRIRASHDRHEARQRRFATVPAQTRAFNSVSFSGRGKAMRRCYWTYIMASKRNGTLYVGVTSDIVRRTWQHREGIIPGFTKTYGVKMLVYFEQFDDVRFAISREKRLKFYRRRWKIRLIESMNPEWRDLYELVTAR